MIWTREQAQAQWGRAQALDRRQPGPLGDVVANTGWIRSLGGAEAYLGLHARAEGVTVEAVHAAVARGDLSIAPAVRGCIYLVSRADLPLALSVAESLSERRIQRELEGVGVDEAELIDVGAAILDALGAGPITTTGLRKALPSGVIRSLGDAGKKVGISTTLPPALRRLEFEGRISRRSDGDRIDHERYAWKLATPQARPEKADAYRQLAERYVRWAGPATHAGFRAWSGLGASEARQALEAADVEAVTVQGTDGGDTWVAAGTRPPDGDADHVALLPALDNLFGLPVSPVGILDPALADVEIYSFGRRGLVPIASVSQAMSRTVAVGGRVAGLWEVDLPHGELVTHTPGPVPLGAIEAEAAGVLALLRDLGHNRAFSLDNDATIGRRVAHVQGLG